MLLNLSKLEEELSTKLYLKENKVKMFTQKVQEYFTILEESIETADRIEILEILSVLITFKESFSSESKWERLTYRSLEIIRENLYASNFHPFFAYSGISHVAFILNQLSVKLPNIKRFLYSVNKLLSINLHEYITISNKPEFFQINNFEFIYGLSGALRYVIDFNNDEEMHSTAFKIVELLVKRSHEKIIDRHKVPGWHYYPSQIELKNMTKSAENGVINYGLSHGMGGPLMTLSLAYSKGIRINGLKEAIDSIFYEYFKASYRINGVIYWPSSLTLEQYIGQEEVISTPRQMSWCYGSIGILRAMYLASIYMSNEENKIFATNELIKIAKMESNDYLLSMPINCHGFAGAVSIMTEMFVDTENEIFLNMARKQMIACIDYMINADFSNIKANGKKKVHLYCYLEGYSGILQTIQSFAGYGDSVHKKRILLM